MKTVKDHSEPRVRVVQSTRDIDELRWFQLARYVDRGLIDELPLVLPHDPTVGDSVYFAVCNDDGLQACVRIITAAHRVPLLDYHSLYPSAAAEIASAGRHMAEVSGLAVHHEMPNHLALSLLCREFFRFCLEHQDTTTFVASIERPLVRILNQVLGIPVEIIGPEIPQYGAIRGAVVPVLVDAARYLTEARWRETRRWEFFTEGLIIDLTDGHDLDDAQPMETSITV